MILGVIADDFTGGTDIASFLVREGMTTVQLIGVPRDTSLIAECDAAVISLKSRSCPRDEAIRDSLEAMRFLRQCGCDQIFFKYCSTFDSTSEGNIGPVAQALMREIGTDFTVFSPALPVNGREVFNGYLFVKGELIEESPMKDHPINPMRDSSLQRLIAMQCNLKCGLINHREITEGVDKIVNKIETLKKSGFNCAVVDAIDDTDLYAQGEAFKMLPLVTGGSGLGMALARAHLKGKKHDNAVDRARPIKGRTCVLSGSCSAMTNQQVEMYREKAPSFAVDIARCVASPEEVAIYAEEVAMFMLQNSNGNLAPLAYATADPETLHKIQSKYGIKGSSKAIENFFYLLSASLKALGFVKFIVAGGETSGQVTKALNVEGFYIGPSIAPGVPWVKSVDDSISLALKSGNFGDRDFFFKAQEDF